MHLKMERRRSISKSQSSKQLLTDRFIPNRIDSSFYSLLMQEEREQQRQTEEGVQSANGTSSNSESQLQGSAMNSSANATSARFQQGSNTTNSNSTGTANSSTTSTINISQQPGDLNQSLRDESALNTYTQLLKLNILCGDSENQQNLGALRSAFALENNARNFLISANGRSGEPFLQRGGLNSDQEHQELQGEGSAMKRADSQKVFKYRKSNGRRGSEMILSYNPMSLVGACDSGEQKIVRKIPKQPFKILDAPRLRDDFYYNLLDWSSKNIITIGLDNAIYTWSAKTNEAYKLAEYPNTVVTSLSWNPRGILLAAGDDNGDVRVFDTEKNKALRVLDNHHHRVGTLSWNNNILTSGSRDSKIFLTDLRQSRPYICKFQGHRQEVCGTKWCHDNDLLASGGNDNKVLIWSLKMQREVARFGDHIAAVKALSWSPHQHHLLATGGGTTDKTLKFWNTATMKLVQSIDTGSQICNMHFSKNSNEIVTTHGFSLNQVAVWQCNNFQRIATLYGHSYRVLYLAPSPDGESVVTGSGDETLRFWRVFPPGKSVHGDNFDKSNLDPYNIELR